MASKIIFYLLFVLDLLLAAFLGWSLFQTHLIPNVAVIIAAAMLVLIPLLLFFLQLALLPFILFLPFICREFKADTGQASGCLRIHSPPS